MISGTNGLLGAADGAFIMQKKRRTDNTALLDIVGRDQPDQELTLEFNRERCVWEFQGAETELWSCRQTRFWKRWQRCSPRDSRSGAVRPRNCWNGCRV